MAIGFYANFIGKFMDEGLTAEEQTEALERVKVVRDQFGLNACANRGCGPDQAAHVRRDFEQAHGVCRAALP